MVSLLAERELVAVALLLFSGCLGSAPETNPVWCPPEPFAMNGPVEIQIGFGTAWASNETGLYRFTVPPDTKDARLFCEEP